MNEQHSKAMAILATTTQDGGIKTVNARDLHKALGVTSRFNDWIRSRVKALGLVEGSDYLKLTGEGVCCENSRSKGRGGNNRVEYHLTLSAAQRITVSGNTEIGRALWDYLKELETIAHREAADLAAQAQRRMIARVEGKAVNLGMNEALKAYREHEGKKAPAHVYSNEASMIDAIALGMSPKAWKREQGLPDAAPVRDHMSADQLKLIAFLEQSDRNYMGMALNSGLFVDYQHRKQALIVLREGLALRWPIEAAKRNDSPAQDKAA